MSTQVATRTKNDLRVIIQSETVREQLLAALPRYYTPEQFTVIVRTAINRNPKLAECDPQSFLTAMITAAQMGIAPNGRDGHLIPRWNSKANRTECNFQPDYKGLVGLVRKNDNVADLYADIVCENDVFRITKGLHRDIVHEVDVKKPRGPIIGAYAVIQYRDGSAPSWDFMSREEIESVRARSDSWKSHISKGYDTPWKTDEGEMFKKTVLKRLMKLADLSQDTMDRINIDREIPLAGSAGPEIKAASIPEVPALPDSSTEEQGDQPQEETSAEPAPAEETPAPKAEKPAQAKVVETPAEPAPAKQGKKLLAKKEAAAPPAEAAPEVNPILTEIRSRLAEKGWTEDQLNGVLVEFKVLDPGQTVEGTSENNLNSIIEYWPEVVEELSKLGAAK